MEKMTDRQRFINCVTGKPIDRTPFVAYFGLWGETVDRWMKEGAKDGDAWRDPELGFDMGIAQLAGVVNHYFDPYFKHEILEEQGEIIIYRDIYGVVNRATKGRSAIPGILSNPVTCREDWKRIKEERLIPDFASRIPENFPEICKTIQEEGKLVQVGDYPFGLFGTLRDLVGLENLMYLFYDDPDFVHMMMDDLTEFWLGIYEEISKYIQIDILHIWEDMSGKAGSLISPQMIRDFMLPDYRRFKEFADRHGIAVLTVDTDGICDELIPLFGSAGINLMLPFEVQAGNNVLELRERFPYMGMLGGIDKIQIAQGRDAIDRELDRISPLIGKPGYIPQLDHLIPPDVSYEDYLYFCAQLKALCGKI